MLVRRDFGSIRIHGGFPPEKPGQWLIGRQETSSSFQGIAEDFKDRSTKISPILPSMST